ncbi:MAG: M20 family metallopeptidase, partial [Coprobacillus sp.]
MLKTLSNKAQEYFYYLHQYPELSGKEYKTTEFIVNELKKLSVFELDTQTKTGVIATINPGCDLVIGFRGDIDALEVEEKTDLEYKSKNIGIMHACGHDAHTSVMLALAHYVSSIDKLNYTIKLIFQHSEEITPGGSSEFFANGSLDNVNHFFSFHVEPNFPTGKILIKSGPLYASIDDFFVNVIGKGGHVATPHFAHDPLPAACAMVSEVSNTVTKRIDPMNPPLIGIGTLQYGNGAPNTISNDVNFCGTIRTHNSITREKSINYLNNSIKRIAQSYDIEALINWEHGEPVLVNDKDLVNKL